MLRNALINCLIDNGVYDDVIIFIDDSYMHSDLLECVIEVNDEYNNELIEFVWDVIINQDLLYIMDWVDLKNNMVRLRLGSWF